MTNLASHDGRPWILMCPPDHYGIEYEINPWMSRARGSDPALARRQQPGLPTFQREHVARVVESLAQLAVVERLVRPQQLPVAVRLVQGAHRRGAASGTGTYRDSGWSI